MDFQLLKFQLGFLSNYITKNPSFISQIVSANTLEIKSLVSVKNYDDLYFDFEEKKFNFFSLKNILSNNVTSVLVKVNDDDDIYFYFKKKEKKKMNKIKINDNNDPDYKENSDFNNTKSIDLNHPIHDIFL